MQVGRPLPTGPGDRMAALHQLPSLIWTSRHHPACCTSPCPALLCPAPAPQQGVPPGNPPTAALCPQPLLPPAQPLCSFPAWGLRGTPRAGSHGLAMMVLTPNNRTAPSFPSHRPLQHCLLPSPSPSSPSSPLLPAMPSLLPGQAGASPHTSPGNCVSLSCLVAWLRLGRNIPAGLGRPGLALLLGWQRPG